MAYTYTVPAHELLYPNTLGVRCCYCTLPMRLFFPSTVRPVWHQMIRVRAFLVIDIRKDVNRFKIAVISSCSALPFSPTRT